MARLNWMAPGHARQGAAHCHQLREPLLSLTALSVCVVLVWGGWAVGGVLLNRLLPFNRDTAERGVPPRGGRAALARCFAHPHPSPRRFPTSQGTLQEPRRLRHPPHGTYTLLTPSSLSCAPIQTLSVTISGLRLPVSKCNLGKPQLGSVRHARKGGAWRSPARVTPPRAGLSLPPLARVPASLEGATSHSLLQSLSLGLLQLCI